EKRLLLILSLRSLLHLPDKGRDRGPVGVFPVDHGEKTLLVKGEGIGHRSPGLFGFEGGGGRSHLVDLALKISRPFIDCTAGSPDSQPPDRLRNLIGGKNSRLLQLPRPHRVREEPRSRLLTSTAGNQKNKN